MMGLPQAVESFSVVGTGILGLVTTAMYDNPLAIYREYIQNSTDAIAGMVTSAESRVEIAVDPSERRVRIWDNGPGPVERRGSAAAGADRSQQQADGK